MPFKTFKLSSNLDSGCSNVTSVNSNLLVKICDSNESFKLFGSLLYGLQEASTGDWSEKFSVKPFGIISMECDHLFRSQ